MSNYNKITDNLYIGNIWSPTEIITNNKKNTINPPITHIISLIKLPENTIKSLQENNIIYFEHSFDDSYKENIITRYNELTDIIEEYLINQEGVILILCQAGKSRSVSITLLILIDYYNLSFEDAYNYILKRREIQINRQFYKDIEIYSKMNQK